MKDATWASLAKRQILVFSELSDLILECIQLSCENPESENEFSGTWDLLIHRLQERLSETLLLIDEHKPETHQALIFVIGSKFRNSIDIKVRRSKTLKRNIKSESSTYLFSRFQFLVRICESFISALENYNPELKGLSNFWPVRFHIVQEEFESYLNTFWGIVQELEGALEKGDHEACTKIIEDRRSQQTDMKEELFDDLNDLRHDNKKFFNQLQQEISKTCEFFIKCLKPDFETYKSSVSTNKIMLKELFSNEISFISAFSTEMLKKQQLVSTTEIDYSFLLPHCFIDNESFQLFMFLHEKLPHSKSKSRYTYIYTNAQLSKKVSIRKYFDWLNKYWSFFGESVLNPGNGIAAKLQPNANNTEQGLNVTRLKEEFSKMKSDEID